MVTQRMALGSWRYLAQLARAGRQLRGVHLRARLLQVLRAWQAVAAQQSYLRRLVWRVQSVRAARTLHHAVHAWRAHVDGRQQLLLREERDR